MLVLGPALVVGIEEIADFTSVFELDNVNNNLPSLMVPSVSPFVVSKLEKLTTPTLD